MKLLRWVVLVALASIGCGPGAGPDVGPAQADVPPPPAETLDQRIAANPADAEALGERAALRRSQGDRDGARADAEAAVAAVDPPRPDLCNLLGRILREDFDEPDKAEAAFRRTLKVDPKDRDANVALGEMALARGNPNEARYLFQAAVQADPRHAPAQRGLGQAQLSRGEPEAAREPFARADELDPDNPVTLAGLGELARINGRLDDSLKQLDRALTIEPKNVDAAASRALARFAHGDRDGARADLVLGLSRADDKALAIFRSLPADERDGPWREPLALRLKAPPGGRSALLNEIATAAERAHRGWRAHALERGRNVAGLLHAQNDREKEIWQDVERKLQELGMTHEQIVTQAKEMVIAGMSPGRAAAWTREQGEKREQLAESLAKLERLKRPKAEARPVDSKPDAATRDGREALRLAEIDGRLEPGPIDAKVATTSGPFDLSPRDGGVSVRMPAPPKRRDLGAPAFVTIHEARVGRGTYAIVVGGDEGKRGAWLAADPEVPARRLDRIERDLGYHVVELVTDPGIGPLDYLADALAIRDGQLHRAKIGIDVNSTGLGFEVILYEHQGADDPRSPAVRFFRTLTLTDR